MADSKYNGDTTLNGRIDRLQGRRLRGWAFNTSEPSSRLSIVVHVDGEAVCTALADSFRVDLKKAGIGDGSHAFTASLPSRYFDGGFHQINVFEQSSGVELKSKNASFLLDKSLGPSTVGAFVIIRNNMIIGYAYDLLDKNDKMQIAIKLNDQVSYNIIANQDASSLMVNPLPPPLSAFAIDLNKCDIGQLARGEILIESTSSGYTFDDEIDVLRTVATLHYGEKDDRLSFWIEVNSEILVDISLDVYIGREFDCTLTWSADDDRVIPITSSRIKLDAAHVDVWVRIAGTTTDILGSPYNHADFERGGAGGFSRARHRLGEWVGVIDVPKVPFIPRSKDVPKKLK